MLYGSMNEKELDQVMNYEDSQPRTKRRRIEVEEDDKQEDEPDEDGVSKFRALDVPALDQLLKTAPDKALFLCPAIWRMVEKAYSVTPVSPSASKMALAVCVYIFQPLTICV